MAAGIAAYVLLAAGITAAVLVTGGSTPAGAAELRRFASCDEVAAWSAVTAVEEQVVLDDVGGDADAASSAGRAGETASDGTGGTNTVVEGVDEIDIVDRLPGDRALVARNGTLSLVDLSGPTLLAAVVGIGGDARISVGGDIVWAASSGTDGSVVVVERLRLDGDTLTRDGRWEAPGFLVDARRSGDTLHVVAVDHPRQQGDVPFADGPVPCDQVWHPSVGADTPAATLVVNLPASGELQPTAAAEVVGAGDGFLVTGDAAYVTTQSWIDEVTTSVHRFDLATLTPTGSGSVPGALPGPFGLSEHEGVLRVATSALQGGGSLAEVFVLDLDGALDIVGRTGRFGHDGETIHGVRFVGETAYVVTFLATDPFWVLDLADPAAPAIVGELEIPGFSGYLHPVDDDHVVGFGPDGSGRTSVRLFSVADPGAPSVVDERAIGDESPVVWDHHAFVGLDDGRFAVPRSSYPQVVEERCEPVAVPEPGPLPVEPDGGNGASGQLPPERPPAICEPVFAGGDTGVVVLDVDGDDLVVVDERTVPAPDGLAAERALPTEAGGWVLVGWDRLIADDGTELVLGG